MLNDLGIYYDVEPMLKYYTADFETTTDKDDLRVWAWGVCDIDNPNNFEYGTDIESFINWCYKHNNSNIYFHNLKFDGEFILSYLLLNGYKYSKEKESKTFNTTISSAGQFYKIEIVFKRYNTRLCKINIYDSLKKLPFSVKKIAEDFDLPIKKGEIDYQAKREVGHILTDEELDYLRNDVEIMARALSMQFKEGLKRMTIGADSLATFKKMLPKGHFETLFPVLPVEIDSDIRRAYRGGFTYCNKIFQGKDVGRGLVYDVNSMYPGVMYYEDMPCGVPIPFENEYEYDEMYPLYIQKIKIDFEIKKDHIPVVQVKKSYFYNDTEYLERSSGDVILWVTNIDLEVIKEQYDILYIEYLGGWKFKKVRGIFRDYIDKFMAIKKTSKGAKRLLAKLLLNNLYGKFATNPDVTGKIPYLDEDDIVRYKLDEPEIKDPVYTALGVFITSYARAKTQRTAQALYDRFCYADTDSIHIIGEEIPTNIDVDDVELGKWALESTFERARFIRAKTYVEEYADGTLNVKCAGMPQDLKDLVTYDNFLTGLKLEGKLLPKKYKGGVILESSEFTIK